MLPMLALRLQLGEMLATELPLAAIAATNEVRLIISDFTPDENMVLADVTFADFTGSTPLPAEDGDQQVGLDPLTGDQIVTMVEPVGGWRWITTALTNLPQVVYGYALVNTLTTPDELLAIEKLDEAIPLAIVGQEINLGRVRFVISQTPIS